MAKQLLIIATFDTKGREAQYVKNRAIKLGVHPVVMDIGGVGKTPIKPEITNGELAYTAGHDLKELKQLQDRPLAIQALQDGGRIVANCLLKQNKLDGVIGLAVELEHLWHPQ